MTHTPCSAPISIPEVPRAALAVALGSLFALSGCGPSGAAQVPPPDVQVTEATRPLPPDLREDATVLGYEGEGSPVRLREGEGHFVCLADDPSEEAFHVACYHRDLEPYMARGRELQAEGVEARESIARRWEEIEAGSLPFPDGPAALYSISAESREALGAGETGRDDAPPAPGEQPATEADGERAADPGDEPAGGRRLTVLYVPYATPEETGLPTDPSAGLPWLMLPGTPTAHVMVHR